MTEPDTARADAAISRIAQRLAQRTDTGTLATLRRFHPVEHGRQSVFETTQVLHGAGVDVDTDNHMRWSVIVHCLALVRGAHGRRSPGSALADLRFSEARLRQLLEADVPLLFDLLPRIARRLASAGIAADWWPLAKLLLHADRDEARANEARAWIASGYIQAVDRAESRANT